MSEETKPLRGFARMTLEKHKEICSKGGVAAHASGHAHSFTTEEARAAGQKGGKKVSENKDHMAMIGRRGGNARKGKMYAG